MADNHGTFVWNELNTHNLARAKDFYGNTLGWTFQDMPMGSTGTYTIIKAGEKQVGGIFDLSTMSGAENIPEHWLSFIAVDDVDRRIEKLKAAGGRVIREPFDVKGAGRIAIALDTGGAAIAWMVPDPNM